MRSFKCLFALVGIVAVGYFVVKQFSKRFADGIKFEGANIQWGSISATGVSLTINLKYRNENKISVALSDFIGAVLYGNHRIARIKLSQSIMLDGNNQITTIPINATVSFIDVGFNLADMIINKSFKQDLNIVGDVTIGSITYPIDYALISN
ncbi:MAG: LEA type 2 family protein [Saprospiraceae bacterium]|nr:LEA type 2 family protein [Saprospiraceae bacterium]